jgi:hypothetical protein
MVTALALAALTVFVLPIFLVALAVWAALHIVFKVLCLPFTLLGWLVKGVAILGLVAIGVALFPILAAVALVGGLLVAAVWGVGSLLAAAV